MRTVASSEKPLPCSHWRIRAVASGSNSPRSGGVAARADAHVPETAFFELASDWLREVLSPSTEQMDRVDKLAIYAAQGVTHIWLVDPDARILEVYCAMDTGGWSVPTRPQTRLRPTF